MRRPPVIVGNRVILYRGNLVDHFLLAVDKQTGQELWKNPLAEQFTNEMACTACPIVVDDMLVLHSARSVQAFDISNGEQKWMTKCATTATSTPVIVGNEVLVCAWNKMGEPALRPEFPSYQTLLDEHDRNKDQTISRDEYPTIWIFPQTGRH